MKKASLMFFTVIVTIVMLAQPVSAGALTSVLTDPAGDAFIWPCDKIVTCPRAGEPFQDIVRAEVSEKGGAFIFVMRLAEGIPQSPKSPWALFVWAWHLDTDPNAFPTGFPYPNPFGFGEEFDIMFLWDGTAFSAFVIDRRPLLGGSDAEIRPASFSIKGSELRVSVDAAVLGDPSRFGWEAVTLDWATKLGASYYSVDFAPDRGLASWPS